MQFKSGCTTTSLPAVNPRVPLLFPVSLCCLGRWIELRGSSVCPSVGRARRDPRPGFRAAPLPRPSPQFCGKIRPMRGLARRPRLSPRSSTSRSRGNRRRNLSRAALSLFALTSRFLCLPGHSQRCPLLRVCWGLGPERSALSCSHGAAAGRRQRGPARQGNAQ